jgi:dienelactone hydrolase
MVDGTDDRSDDLKISPKSNAMLLFNPVLDNGPGGFGAAVIGDRYPALSPAHNVSRDDPPAILFLGSQDKLIPVATLETLKANLNKVGVRCDLRVYEGQGHGFFNAKGAGGKYYALTVREADRFLASLGWLKGEPTISAPTETSQ